MVNVVEIRLWNQAVGAIAWDHTRNYASFEFFKDFLSSGLDVSPIHMPIDTAKGKIFSFPNLNQETFKGLPGMLSDVLPDDFGNRLIDQWLLINNIQKENFTPLDRLCYIGKRGMGALEFVPNTLTEKSNHADLEIDSLVDLARKVMDDRYELSLNAAESESLNELIKVGTSAGGQRPKAVIAYNPATNEIRSGQTKTPSGFEHYLFKFDGISNQALGDPLGFGRIEYAYYLMALSCGIEMMESRLFEESGRAHFMTKRFDRTGHNEKIHTQTLCSIAHFDYKSPGAYSYDDAFEVMRKLRLPHNEAEQLFRRMVFNVIARNQDDHTKNISFMMNKSGKWKLSPAYDVTYSYNPGGIWTSTHQMSVNGKRDQFTLSDLTAIGERISLKNSKEIVQEISAQVSEWKHFAEKAGIPEQQSALLRKAFRLDIV